MAYEELNEIRKMTRRGYEEALAEEKKVAAAAVTEDEDRRAKSNEAATRLGYTEVDLALLPEQTSVEEGAGNPLAAIEVKPGEAVMVIGCRSGADCFLAANAAGTTGSVVGIEETAEEVTIAREAVREAGYANIEIRPGENENLPAADKSFDLVITNCAVTFSYDKPRVLAEAARVLRKSATLLLCEPVLVKGINISDRKAAMGRLECLENAVGVEDYKMVLKRAGFKKIKVIDETEFPVSRMLSDKRAQAGLAKGEISVGDIETMSGTAISVKIKAIR